MAGIRDARRADAPAIARVVVASWRAAYAGLLPAEYLAGLSVEARTEQWDGVVADPGDNHVLVLTDPEVVGFAAVGPALDGEAGVGQLYAIYLAPLRWGRGEGRRLHDAAVARLDAAGFGRSVLWVLRGNDRATRFYRAAGWRPDGVEQTEVGFTGVVFVEDRWVRTARPVTGPA